MIFNYPSGRYSKLVEAVELANKIIQDPKLLAEISKVERFKDSRLTGAQVSVIMRKHIEAKTPIYIRTFRAGRLRRWARRDIVNGRVYASTPNIIEYNSGKLYRYKLDIVETIIHEYVHSVDTLDPGDTSIDHGHFDNDSSKNYYCAPNTVGRIAKNIMLDSGFIYSETEGFDGPELETEVPETQYPRLKKLNYIAIGDGGGYSNYGAYRYSEADLKKIVDHMVENEIHRLAIYCHGGLVNENNGAAAVEGVVSAIHQKDDLHTLGFIWKTGVDEVLREDLLEAMLSGLGSILMRILLKYIKSEIDSTKSTEQVHYKDIDEYLLRRKKLAGTPLDQDFKFTWETNKSIDVEDDAQLLAFAEEEAKRIVHDFDNSDTDYDMTEWLDMPYSSSLNPEVSKSVLNDFNEQGLLRNSNEKGFDLGRWWTVAQILYRIYKRKRDKKWHGAHATVVEEILRVVYVDNITKYFWDKMKQKAIDMWKPGNPGNQLLTMLNDRSHKVQLEFIGHSAGANCGAALLDLLNKEKYINVSLNNCILMAPSTDYKLFRKTYVDKRDLYNKFTMYALTDAAEKQDDLLDYTLLRYFYPSSLLYLISGIMENTIDMPLAGMNRFKVGVHPYDDDDFTATYNFLYESNTPALTPSREYSVRDHGEFDNDDVILGAINDLING